MSTPLSSSEALQITLPQRAEAFTVTSFTGHEVAGELYRLAVHVTTEEGDETLANALLQTQASFFLIADGAPVRAIHGIVARVQSHGVMLGGRRAYSLTIVPSFWRLRRRRTRRIFQAMTTLDIATQVLGEWNVANRLVIERELLTRAYAVQYDETDHAFLVRLFAEEGLLYYFEHPLAPSEGQGETLVVADLPRDFSPMEGDTTLHFQRDPGSQIHEDMVTWFASQARVRSTQAMVRGFDFQRPDTSLGDDAATPDGVGPLDVIYEHEGSYEEDLAARPAQVRLDRERTKAQRIDGSSFCRRLVPGTTFSLVEHEDTNLNRDFVVTRIQHEGYAPGTAPAGRALYQNRFRCAPADVPLRPAHKPRKPHQVAESAIVVGPENQEIHTDEFGRVKVQFPWDLEGKGDDRSSCWIRVVQAWAGAGWGAQFIPRVGMEVIVTFLGGDLDRPIVTGCVYNATHPPPFKLPDEKSRSGFRTSSTPGDVGANELSFDDAAGGEQLFVHASRNYDEVVENDRTSRIGGSSKSEVALGSNDQIGGHASLDVVGQRSTRVGEVDRLDVGGRSTTSVGGDRALEVQGDAATTIHKTYSLEVKSNRSLVVGSPDDPAHSDHYVYGTASLAADDRIVVRATKGILIECGESTIELSADKIVLRAPTIELAPTKTLSATTGGGPSLTMGEDVEILTKKLKIFTESGALELDTELKVQGDKIKLGYDPSKPDQDKSDVTPETKPFQVKLSDYFLQPYSAKKYHLMVEGLRMEGSTDGEGVVKQDIPKEAKQVVVRLWLDDYPQGRQRLYTLKLGELPPVDQLEGAKVRLKNLGYYQGPIDSAMSVDLRLAVTDFQDDHKDTHGLEATGELDTGTAGALEEVHGS